MSISLYIFPLFCIFIFIGCSIGSAAYLKTYPGVAVKDADEKEKFFFHNEKLSFLSADNDLGRYREESTGKKFTIPVKHFSSNENSLFYSVNTKSGLFLRSEPNRNSEKILLMPYKSSGKIVGIQKEFSIIEKIRAPWLKIEFKNKVGWAFAGYIRVFANESELKDFLKQREAFETDKFLEVDKMSNAEVSELLKTNKPQKIYENEDYEILDFRFLYKKNEECTIDRWNQLVYKNKNTNEYFTIKNKAGEIHIKSEKITDFNFPVKGVITTKFTCCWCCCGCDGAYTYFLAKDKPYFFERNISDSHGKSECHFSTMPDENYSSDETELRVSEDNTMYAIVKNPPCGYNPEQSWKLVKESPLDMHLLIQFKDRKFSYEKKLHKKELFQKNSKMHTIIQRKLQAKLERRTLTGIKFLKNTMV